MRGVDTKKLEKEQQLRQKKQDKKVRHPRKRILDGYNVTEPIRARLFCWSRSNLCFIDSFEMFKLNRFSLLNEEKQIYRSWYLILKKQGDVVVKG